MFKAAQRQQPKESGGSWRAELLLPTKHLHPAMPTWKSWACPHISQRSNADEAEMRIESTKHIADLSDLWLSTARCV